MLTDVPWFAAASLPVECEQQSIGIVVYEGFSLLRCAEVANAFELADSASRVDSGVERSHRTVFLSARGGPVRSSSGISVLTQPLDASSSRRCALFVAGGDGASLAAQDPVLVHALLACAQTPESLRAIDNGTLILDAVLVAGNVLSISGNTARKPFVPHAPQAQAERANGSADPSAVRLVVRRRPDDRDRLRLVLCNVDRVDASLDPASPEIVSRYVSMHEKMAESAAWIIRNCDRALTVSMAAERAKMSERSYFRHFLSHVGLSPSEHLQRARLERAMRFLIDTDLPVDKIARRCGLASGECLARLFRRLLDTSPTEFRERLAGA